MAHVEDAIAKTARGIREEFQIWRFGPVGIRYNGLAIPRRNEPEPPGNIKGGFTIHGDMEGVGGDQDTQKHQACGGFFKLVGGKGYAHLRDHVENGLDIVAEADEWAGPTVQQSSR